MLSCPNKNLDSWKKLVNEVGDFNAFKAYMQRNDGSIPTVAEALLFMESEKKEENKSAQVAAISDRIKSDLPIEIFNALTILDDVPGDILGREDLFLSMKDIFQENNITDPILINWAGINKATIGHPRSIKSEEQLLAIVQNYYNQKAKVDKYAAEFKTNPLALESFNKWKEALEDYPIVFKDIMLGHAVKHLINPNRRSKYVLQLSKVALTNTYGMLVNKPHEASRLGKLYDMEVINSLTDSLEFEPSASGAGYWVHVPRTQNDGKNLNFASFEDFQEYTMKDIVFLRGNIKKYEERKDPIKHEKLKQELEKLKNKEPEFSTQETTLDKTEKAEYDLQEYEEVRTESTYTRWDWRSKPHSKILGENYEGYYIHAFNVGMGTKISRVIPITKEQAEKIFKIHNTENPGIFRQAPG
jgi:hypothetical protein